MSTETKNQEQESEKEKINLKALMTLPTEDRLELRKATIEALKETSEESNLNIDVEAFEKSLEEFEKFYEALPEEGKITVVLSLLNFLPFPTQYFIFKVNTRLNKESALDIALSGLSKMIK